MHIFNRRILERMKERKVTQRDIARLLGVTQPTVHQRLSSGKTFEVDDLIKICAYLEVPIGEILYEVVDEGKDKEAAQILTPADLLMISTKRHEEIVRLISEQSKRIDELAELVKKALGRNN